MTPDRTDPIPVIRNFPPDKERKKEAKKERCRGFVNSPGLLCLLGFACFALRIEFGPLCVFILGPFYFIFGPFCYRVASFWDGKPSRNGFLEGSWHPTLQGGAGDGKGSQNELSFPTFPPLFG